MWEVHLQIPKFAGQSLASLGFQKLPEDAGHFVQAVPKILGLQFSALLGQIDLCLLQALLAWVPRFEVLHLAVALLHLAVLHLGL